MTKPERLKMLKFKRSQFLAMLAYLDQLIRETDEEITIEAKAND